MSSILYLSQNVTGKITDSEDNAILHVDKHLVQTSESDKGRQQLVNSSIQDSDFHIAHLYGFNKYLQDRIEETEEDLEEKKVP